MIMTVVRTARLAGLNPEKYVAYVLDKMNTIPTVDDFGAPSVGERYFGWHEGQHEEVLERHHFFERGAKYRSQMSKSKCRYSEGNRVENEKR